MWMPKAWRWLTMRSRTVEPAKPIRRRSRVPLIEILEDRTLLANWSGNLTGNTVWSGTQNIVGNVDVPTGDTLTIEPGTVVQSNGASLIVDGTLSAQGATFTSVNVNPGPGSWGSIQFNSDSVGNVLSNSVISYGGSFGNGMVLDLGGPLTMNNTLLSESGGPGLRMQQSSPSLNADTFQNNNGPALSSDLDSNPTITGETSGNFSANGVNGLQFDGGTTAATLNWTNPDVVYVVEGNITVANGKTLNIGAGQTVKVTGGDIAVDGTLNVQGTAAAPVTFTSLADDSVGGDTNDNGTANVPHLGDWAFVQLNADSSANVITNVQMFFGGSFGNPELSDQGGPLTLNNSVVSDSGGSGVRFVHSTASLNADVFQNNNGPALSADLDSNPTITGETSGSFSGNGVNGLQLDGGTTAESLNWTNPDVVYLLKSNITVANGLTLTIGAGQIIKVNGAALLIDGTLNAEGTSAAPIIFTSFRDDASGGNTDNDNGNTSPAPGDWAFVQFNADSTNNMLNYVNVFYAGSFGQAAVYGIGLALTMDNSVVSYSGGNGARLQQSEAWLDADTFQNNDGAAISSDLVSSPTITGETVANFSGNGTNGLLLDGGTTTTEGEYWTNTDVVYVIKSNITIGNATTLQINAGQIIKISGASLTVDGRVLADGTAAAPVIFTSLHDESVGGHTDNASSTPNPGDWSQIKFDSDSFNNVLDDVDVSYAGSFAAAAIYDLAGALTLDNSVISNNYAVGVRLAQSTASLADDAFLNNGSGALSMDLDSNPTITGETPVDFNGNGNNGLTIDGGTSLASLNWTNPDVTYTMTGNVTLAHGMTLTIAAGQVIKSNGAGLIIDGTLNAQGTAAAPIVFTSLHDESVGGNTDNASSTPHPGDWSQVRLDADSTGNVMNYVDVSYAGGFGAVALYDQGGPLTLDNSIIRNNQSTGVRLQQTNAALAADTFQNNSGPALTMDLDSNPTITGETAANFNGNNFNGLELDGGTTAESLNWTNPDVVYILNGSIDVANGTTLTIGPGQIIKSIGGSLTVDGALSAQGTAAAPVIFTSIYDAAHGGNTANSSRQPGPGDWNEVQFNADSSGNVMSHVAVLYAGSFGQHALFLNGGSLILTASQVSYAGGPGIDAISGALGQFVNDLIFSTSNYGIAADSAGSVTAINDTIDSNSIGVLVGAASITLTNDLITNSSSAGIDNQQSGGTVNVSFSDVYNPHASSGNYQNMASQTGANGNVSGDPLYVNAAQRAYGLSAGSPAIDTGTSAGAPAVDFADNPRTPGAIDMGALQGDLHASAAVTTVALPAAAGSYGANAWTGAISGSASDAAFGIQAEQVSILDSATNQYWNGTAFAGSTEVFLSATLANAGSGLTSWSVPFPLSNFPADDAYTVHARATDDLGNIESSGPIVSFTIDIVAPLVTIATNSTNNTEPSFTGSAGTNPGDLNLITITIYSGTTAAGPPVETFTATASGGFYSQQVAQPLTPGATYTAQASQADAAGNIGVSGATTFFVAQSSVAITLLPVPTPTTDAAPIFGGGADSAPGAGSTITVNLYRGASATGTPVEVLTTTASNGIYAVTASPALTDGIYTAQASQLNSSGQIETSGTTTFTLVTLAFATTTLPDWDVLYPGYNPAIVVKGGGGNVVLSLTRGTLPTGVTLPANGATPPDVLVVPLVGTPSVLGTYQFTLTATDSIGGSVSQNYTVTIHPQVTLGPATLPSWTVNQPYRQTLQISGGAGTVTSSVVTGFLPNGLNFNSVTGVISGTPTQPGTYHFGIQASDTIFDDAVQNYSITINYPLQVDVTQLPSGLYQNAYQQTILTGGGTAPVVMSVTSGALPQGIIFNPATGVLGGTPPIQAGTFNFTITATDAAGVSVSQPYVLNINAAPDIITGNNETLSVGSANSGFNITAWGDPTPSLTVPAGSIPAGLSFVDHGGGLATLTGIPAVGTGGQYQFTITASNGVTPDDTQTFSLTIDETTSITSPAATTVIVGTPMSFLVTTHGYPYPSISIDHLPAGLSYADNHNGTATISGTPAADTGGVNNFTVSVGGFPVQSFLMTLDETLTFTGAVSHTFTVGTSDFFTIPAVGYPTPTYTISGALPAGLEFRDQTDGNPQNGQNAQAVFDGVPSIGTGGSYPLTVTVSNGIGPPVSEAVTLTVDEPLSITSPASATFTVGTPGLAFTVTTAGFPTGALTIPTGSLPAGLSFTDEGNGTATITGTPAAGDGGTYPISITASNGGVTTGVTQSFTLTIDEAAAITSGNNTTFGPNTSSNPGPFTVVAAGFPYPTLTETGAMPPGMTFTDNGHGTATIAGAPGATASGPYVLTITAHNGIGMDATQTFTLTINQSPAFSSATSATFIVGTAGPAFTVTTTGYPAPILTNLSGGMPNGLTFTDNGNGTATIAGTPAPGSASTGPILIMASSNAGTVEQALTLTIEQAPAITTANNFTFTAGTFAEFPVVVTGAPFPTVTIPAGSLPSGLQFDGTSIFGTPSAGAGGSYPFTITASNGVGANATQSFTLTVDETPVISSGSSTTFNVGTAGTFTVTTAHDYPSLTTLTETGTLPGGIVFTDNGNGTASVHGNPNAGAGGIYPFTITASNGISPAAAQSFTLTVNQTPAFTSANNVTFTAAAGYGYRAQTFTVSTTGFPTSALTIPAGSLPSGVSLFDNHNGTATIFTDGSFSVPPGGVYSFTITANNGVTTISQPFTLTLLEPPSFASRNNAAFVVGVNNTYTITATGYPLPTLTESGPLPAGVTFTDNGNGTGTLAGMPAPGGPYSFPVAILGSNSQASDVAAVVNLTVYQVTSAASATFTAGQFNSFTMTVTGGGPAPTFSILGGLPSGLNFNGPTGVISGIPSPGTGGNYAILVDLETVDGFTPYQTFNLTINAPPSITSASSTVFTAGTAGTFNVTALGFPNPTLSYSGNVPSGVTFTDNGNGTASLQGKPAAGTLGTYPLTIIATDGSGKTSQGFVLIVGQAPVITSGAGATFTIGSTGTFTVTATGSPTPTFIRGGALPTGVSFTDNGNGTATLQGAPASGSAASYPFTISAGNGIGANFTQTFTLTVNAPPPSRPGPTALSATPGAAEAILSWSAVAGATSYNVYHATKSGQETLLKAGVTGIGYTDSGLANGTYYYQVTAVNSAGESARSGEAAITLGATAAAPTLGILTPTQWTIGQPYTGTIAVSGGTSPYSGLVAPGFPAGLSASMSGNTISITGTPTQGGAVSMVQVSANDAAGHSASGTYTLTINPVISFNPAGAPAAGTVGAAYNQTITASGGTGVKTMAYSLTAGSSADGLTFTLNNADPGAVVITGTPTAAGTVSFSVTATDSVGAAQPETYALTINAATAGAPPVPTGVTAAAGTGSVTLTWNASPGATSYNIYRSTTSGGEGSTPIQTGVTATSFTDTGLTGGTPYYYEVAAVAAGVSSANSTEALATPLSGGILALAIDAGYSSGPPIGSFVAAPADFSTGSTYSTTNAINTSNVTNPAPQAVYQTEAYGADFTCTIPKLTPGAAYTVRLHFAEIYSGDFHVGARVMNVSINGIMPPSLTNFDIYKTAGGPDIAVVESDTTTADSKGTIIIEFKEVSGDANAKVDGIEILTAGPTGPTTSELSVSPSPTTTPPTISATVSDAGSANIKAAEYFIDSAGTNGAGTALSGTFTNGTVSVSGTLMSSQFSALSPGTHTIYVNGEDSAGNWGATASTTFFVGGAPALGVLTVTQWTVNQPNYQGTIAITNGTAPFSKLVALGLPPGLTAGLNGSTISITGTPTLAAPFNVQVSVTDATGATATGTDTLTINPSISLGLTSNWIPAASMTYARNGQTATLLNDGTVLIAGGNDGNGNALSSAELYDPTNGAWTLVPQSMVNARYDATATLLNDGTVLIVGGNGGHGPLNTAELYNPANESFSTVGNMSTARANAGATLLNNGMVLVAGGTFSSENVDLYNPSTKSWSQAAPMSWAMEFDTAVTLSNGKVLVTGPGEAAANGAPITTAELYDPAANQWSSAGSWITAPAPYDGQTTTVLPNGLVLIAGGEDAVNENALSGAELYNPNTNTFSAAASMSTPRYDATATLLRNGMVLVLGGQESDGFLLGSAEVYDPVRNQWISGGNIAALQGETMTTLDNGQVLIVGGQDNSNYPIANGETLKLAELYYPPGVLPPGNVGTAYKQTISASGGTGSKTVTYQVTAGAIPAGLTLTPSKGDPGTLAITGTATASGTVTFSVPATDNVGAQQTESYTLTINAAAANAPAADVSWVGPSIGFWDVGSNWSTGLVPGPADNVVINTASAATISLVFETVSVNSLTTAVNDTLSILGGSFTVAANSTLNGDVNVNDTGTMTVPTGVTLQASGTFTVAIDGTLDINGNVEIEPGGHLSDPGKVTVGPTGNLSDQDAISVPLGGTADVFGQLTEGTGGALDVAGALVIEPSAALDVIGSATIEPGATYTPPGTVNLLPGGDFNELALPTPLLLVSGGTYTYDEKPHAATGVVVGAAFADLGTPTFTYTDADGNVSGSAPFHAGTYVVTASFAGDDSYASASTTTTLTIALTSQLTQNENGTPASETVKALLGSHYSDPDGSANTKPGIAVVQTSGNGVWQYSTNGSIWTPIGAVSRSGALLLPAADSLRFVPASNSNGLAQLLYVAWDGSAGKAGGLANVTTPGGATAFGLDTGTLAVTVNPVLTWAGAGAALTPIVPGTYGVTSPGVPAGNTIAAVFAAYFQDQKSAASVGVAITSAAGAANGVWQFSTNGGRIWTAFPAVSTAAALLLSANDEIRYVPKNSHFAGAVSLTALAWDGSVGTSGKTGNPTKLGSCRPQQQHPDRDVQRQQPHPP